MYTIYSLWEMSDDGVSNVQGAQGGLRYERSEHREGSHTEGSHREVVRVRCSRGITSLEL